MSNRRNRGNSNDMLEDIVYPRCQHIGCNQYGKQTKNAGCYCAMHRAEIQLRTSIESNWPECICHSTVHFGNRYPPPGGYCNIEPFIQFNDQNVDTMTELFKKYRKLPVLNNDAYKKQIKLEFDKKAASLNQQVKRFSGKFFDGDVFRYELVHQNGKRLGLMSYERYHIGFCVTCHGWDYSQGWHCNSLMRF